MTEFDEYAGRLVATAAEIARLQGAEEEASVLEKASPRLVEIGYGGWHDETTLYALTLEVPVAVYATLEENRKRLEKATQERISQLTRTEIDTDITEVVITPILVDKDRRPKQAGDATEEIAEVEIPEFWQPGFFRLFISHIADNREQAHNLKAALANFQIAAFVAHDDIEPTKEWQNEIESALRTMDALAAILVPGFVGSRWCDQEVGFAFGREKLVIPLRLESDPHGFLSRFQGLTIAGLSAAEVASSIFNILIQKEFTTQRLTESLVERLVRSDSFNSTRRTMNLIEMAPGLSEGQKSRLMRAIDENYEVSNAFGVPQRIRNLVAQQ